MHVTFAFLNVFIAIKLSSSGSVFWPFQPPVFMSFMVELHQTDLICINSFHKLIFFRFMNFTYKTINN